MNSVYKLIYHKKVLKFIEKQPLDIQSRIAISLKGLLSVPPEGDIKKLLGSQGLYRLRIGTFRALFSINHREKIIYIEMIGNRGDIYR
ncbi:type II toxin-antitoxin system RelE family toxin [Shimazuella kribbensis]|uniref:type II toxin-antitoxin system RelE family toxin n=1 Tax=Shimazuella kribbensis TaxID=139808 RepID=UPI00040158CC|nr:type II toxin-antitoxin system RelE/ParE family toxin [Shimazuella kribbensis]